MLQLTKEMRDIATALGLDPDAEFERFAENARTKGIVYRNPAAGFRVWCRRAAEPPAPARPTPLPPDFALTPELRQYALDHRVEPKRAFEQFRNKAEADGWTHKNWGARFKVWIDGAVNRGLATYVAPPPTVHAEVLTPEQEATYAANRAEMAKIIHETLKNLPGGDR
jgi:hypothetical protein